MKSFLTRLASRIVGFSLTASMAYGFYFNVEWALNLSQVVFWMLIVISYPIMAIVLIGSFTQKDKDKASEAAREMKMGMERKALGVIHSGANIIVMAISGFVWLPIIYFVTVCFVKLSRYVSVSILEETASK